VECVDEGVEVGGDEDGCRVDGDGAVCFGRRGRGEDLLGVGVERVMVGDELVGEFGEVIDVVVLKGVGISGEGLDAEEADGGWGGAGEGKGGCVGVGCHLDEEFE